ncbi:MAG: hypothetical protein ACC645_18400 [Pirellulales bacterium]
MRWKLLFALSNQTAASEPADNVAPTPVLPDTQRLGKYRRTVLGAGPRVRRRAVSPIVRPSWVSAAR